MARPVTHWGSSWLITPGSTPGWFNAARNSGCDVALVDLEDSVAPDDKDAARTNAVGWFMQAGGTARAGASVLGVRLNSPNTVPGLKDLLAMAESGVRPDVVLVPKVESARDVDLVAAIIDAGGGQRRVWALIETPRAIQGLTEILRSGALAGVVFGTADYAAAAGCGRGSRAMWYPRAILTAGAAAAGLPVIDSPFFDLEDVGGLRRESDEAAELGFVGKFAIHPQQLPTIRAAFAPSAQDLAHARAVVTSADAGPGGITTVHGQMVGPPLVAAARALTARADQEAHRV